MKVFMLGWEFPPFISGGLGTACYGLTKGLDEIGVNVVFVLPTAIPVATGTHVSMRNPASPIGPQASVEGLPHVQLRTVQAALQAYASPATYRPPVTQGQHNSPGSEIEDIVTAAHKPTRGFLSGGAGAHYGGNLMDQVRRYAQLATSIAMGEAFDVVHAHDWMTYPAGLAVAGISGKPLVVHVHSTEFDRSGEHVNQQVYDIERAGMHGADKVVCVSYLTRSIVITRYGVPPEKVAVVYNAVDMDNNEESFRPITRNEKIVLFLGRITMQKGPEYFLAAAKKVLEKFPNVRFVMAGSGDMFRNSVELAAQMGIGSKVTFPGFLRGGDLERIFHMADLYVMPSVSEPFGIAPLEALSRNVPVIISKQSGVSEVLTHVLKVDFWDINEMANKILAVLRHPPLQRVLREQGHFELHKLSWKESATRCHDVYQSVLAGK